MPRIFNRIIEFYVEGEIYDRETTPESILKNYDWSFDDNVDGNIQLFAHHKDTGGRITKIIKSSRIKKYKKPDSEFFLKAEKRKITDSIAAGHLNKLANQEFLVIGVYTINFVTHFETFYSPNFDVKMKDIFNEIFNS